MSSPSSSPAQTPLPASILAQGPYLIVSIHAALDDEQLVHLQRDLIDQVGRQRSRGLIVDVAALDVLDSFATHTLSELARMARLRGAETVVVGIAPDVAMAMVQLNLAVRFTHTALDLEEGLACLTRAVGSAGAGSRDERHDGA